MGTVFKTPFVEIYDDLAPKIENDYDGVMDVMKQTCGMLSYGACAGLEETSKAECVGADDFDKCVDTANKMVEMCNKAC